MCASATRGTRPRRRASSPVCSTLSGPSTSRPRSPRSAPLRPSASEPDRRHRLPVADSRASRDDGGMNVEIRRIHAGEGPQLRVLRLRALADDPSAFSSTYAREELFPETRWVQWAKESAAGDDHALFLAIVDGISRGLIGAARAEPIGDLEDRLLARSTGEHGVGLYSMWTDPEYRGHGLGRRLVTTSIAWAESIRAPYVALWVIRGNDRAISLYRAPGFVEAETVRSAPGDPCADEIRMVRPPAPVGA